MGVAPFGQIVEVSSYIYIYISFGLFYFIVRCSNWDNCWNQISLYRNTQRHLCYSKIFEYGAGLKTKLGNVK